MRRAALVVSLTLGACAPDEEAPPDWVLPPVGASSKYVDYSTWADAAPVCLDDRLAQWDEFIEEAAAFLEVEPPSGRIRYVAVPLPYSTPFGEVKALPDYDVPDNAWGCSETAAGCYRYLRAEDRGLIFAKMEELFHELAHAVDIAALGYSHPVLMEGLAQFVTLSDPYARVPEDFPTHFMEMVAAGPHPNNYALAMHFVGSMIERGGIEEFKELRAQLARDDDLDALADAYARVYGEDLEAGLAAMTTPIHGLGLSPDPCAAEETLGWTSPGQIETTLRGTCGDGSFVGFGSGFSKRYLIELEEAGDYEFTVEGPGAVSPGIEIGGCPGFFGLAGYGNHDEGHWVVVDVRPGLHVLRVHFPPDPEAKGEVTLKVAYMGAKGP